MKYQTKMEEKKALVVRLPAGVKARLDSASQSQGISQSRLASELISEGLNQSVSLEAILDDVGVVIEDDDKSDVTDWLKRICPALTFGSLVNLSARVGPGSPGRAGSTRPRKLSSLSIDCLRLHLITWLCTT